MSFWFDDQKRLQAAKHFQQQRIQYMQRIWSKDKDLQSEGFHIEDQDIQGALNNAQAKMNKSPNVTDLLLSEAQLTKQLYKIAANRTKQKDFVRQHDSTDNANAFLNHGNYLAYGLAATTLWVLGIPHGFAVMHGKTRRGALVFDVADLIKDTLILPWAFICAKEGATEQEFRQQCLQNFTKHKALDFMFETVKQLSIEHAAHGMKQDHKHEGNQP
jgi:CRISPR-associated protein Cas1